jgi:CDP-glycerol glycerophosphotransferase
MTPPDVSVIVIGYNDAARLPRAIASVQWQTLRNLEIIVVDDASTDDTARVVAGLAASDPRIRYECLPENSGGCSAPRNRGVEVARGAWVMFCDSDDEYERHACKNLLLAAERLDADVVCGAAERVDVRTGRAKRWKPELHEREESADGLEQLPELLADTISVNKIYRRSMLVDNEIEFPLGLLFEDQLFTLQAFAAARRLAAIPQTVYRWYVDSISDEPSITQRRSEARNVESRVEVNRRIDRFLSDRGLPTVQAIKDLKFLRHDVYLYLSSTLDIDDETAQQLLDHLRPYVANANLQPVWQLRPALRVAIYHLLIDDLAGVRSAMRFVRWASVVDVPITMRDSRQMWACEHLASGRDVGGLAAREWLDVTALHLLDVPFTQRRFLHRLDDLRIDGARVRASGTTVDYDGSIAECDTVELRFAIGNAGTAVRVTGVWTGERDGRRCWQIDGVAADALGRPLDAADWGTVALAVRRGPLTNVTSTRVGDCLPALSLAWSGPSAGPDRCDLSVGDAGAIVWRAGHSSGRMPAAKSTGRIGRFLRNEVVSPLAAWLGGVLPARRVVVFDTSSLRPMNADARVVSSYLNVHHPDVPQVWVHRGRPTRVPEFAEAVERLSPRHHWLVARARWRVDDGTAAVDLRLRPRGRTAFIMDGVPIRREGLDDPSVLGSRAAIRAIRRRSRQWSTVIAPSGFGAEMARSAFGYSGDVTPAGLARLDGPLSVLQQGDDARRRLRAALDLDIERPIIIYAPAARGHGRDPHQPLIDLERWAGEIGDRVYLLVRSHPSERLEISSRWRWAVRDIGEADLIGDHLIASDLLITDYSSLVGDAALAGLPVLLFQPDHDVYVNRQHGLYVDLSALAPTTGTTADLITGVRAWLDNPLEWDRPYLERRRSFAVERCGPGDGASTARAVAALLGADATGAGAA